MTTPNRLVFVDFPTDEMEDSAVFYEKVFGWTVERRIPDLFCRIVPGGYYKILIILIARYKTCTWVFITWPMRVIQNRRVKALER